MHYFTFSELVRTDQICPNMPTAPYQLSNLACLWSTLNEVRERLGYPIFINSAFRTPDVNRLVGGHERSQHMHGRAADIRTIPSKMADLLDILEDCDLSQIINYDTFYHIVI